MTKTKLTILILALVCVLTALLCIPIMAAEEESVSGGLTLRGAVESSTSQVYSIDTYEMANDLDIMPTTLEAWVYVPSLAASSHLGTLYGNFYIDSKYGTSFLNFEVATGGIPRVHWADSICGDYDILFENSALDQDAWTHLSIVYDGNSGIVSCYLNGELSEEKYYFPTIDPDVLEVPMYLGGDKNHMNPNYFKGSIGDLTVYSDVRTASERSALFAVISIPLP